VDQIQYPTLLKESLKMKSQWLRMSMGGLLVCLLAVASASAGQVVTERERNWARQALAREAALHAAQMPDNTLSVLYFSNSTGQPALDALRKGLAFMLMTDLSTIDGLVLVERVKLQALVEEMGLGASGLVEPGSAPRVGRLLGARFLVSGDISGVAGMGSSGGPMDEGAVSRALETLVRIDSGLLDVPAGQGAVLPAAQGPVSVLFQIEKALLFSIVDQLKIALSEKEKTALRVPMTTNGRALFYFFMGLQYSDMGMADRAGSYYEKANRADPGLKPASDALKELRQLGLYGPPKKPVSLLKSVRNRTSLTNSLAPANAIRRVRTPADVSLRQSRNQALPDPDPDDPEPVDPDDIDNDGDGFTENRGDCDDTDYSINPYAVEDCSDIDRNCNGYPYDAPDGC
jgi:curli biogenesis system outer membrane secretion channel CsgG